MRRGTIMNPKGGDGGSFFVVPTIFRSDSDIAFRVLSKQIS